MSGTLSVGSIIISGPNSAGNTFNRLRLSNPVTLFEFKANQNGFKNELIFDEIVTSGGSNTIN